eukprot:gnl/MRDRNA2_/MRDRNA2_303094_c0_seq1.p1 gnl/MRDRNA2_/MRDRNA2_303094_c0~~gnl/MRDRNA2_/MRDRNA2_303094_c0_seq1.p1  ORF type:complete len:131 (+),score=11.89 gnl/MRDRNA2_/MRDRNA2_303094_c0_seq1:254-646(+)
MVIGPPSMLSPIAAPFSVMYLAALAVVTNRSCTRHYLTNTSADSTRSTPVQVMTAPTPQCRRKISEDTCANSTQWMLLTHVQVITAPPPPTLHVKILKDTSASSTWGMQVASFHAMRKAAAVSRTAHSQH